LDDNGGIVMEQKNSKSQQPESGQDEALAEGKAAETEPDTAPPQKKGFFSTLISVIRRLLLIPFQHLFDPWILSAIGKRDFLHFFRVIF